MTETFYILVLPSIHHVMEVEKEALAQGIAVELVPTPRQISSDCGMVVKISGQNLEKVVQFVNSSGMPEGRLYHFQETRYEFLEKTGTPRKPES